MTHLETVEKLQTATGQQSTSLVTLLVPHDAQL